MHILARDWLIPYQPLPNPTPSFLNMNLAIQVEKSTKGETVICGLTSELWAERDRESARVCGGEWRRRLGFLVVIFGVD